MRPEITYLNEIERCVSWIASWTIHHANHIRQGGEVTVGGHRAPSASLSTIRPRSTIRCSGHGTGWRTSRMPLRSLTLSEIWQAIRPAKSWKMCTIDLFTGSRSAQLCLLPG